MTDYLTVVEVLAIHADQIERVSVAVLPETTDTLQSGAVTSPDARLDAGLDNLSLAYPKG